MDRHGDSRDRWARGHAEILVCVCCGSAADGENPSTTELTILDDQSLPLFGHDDVRWPDVLVVLQPSFDASIIPQNYDEPGSEPDVT